MTTRRGFLQGILAACAAPAIVKVANLMPVTSAIIHIPTDEEFFAIMHPDTQEQLFYGGARGGSRTVFDYPTKTVRELYSRELARNVSERIDRTIFEVLTRGTA